jgi:GNAT superfamily N-acetyltransferase
MMEADKYSAVEVLPNGRRAEIRALRPEDQSDYLAAVKRTSDQTLYRRFSGTKRGFSEQEVAFFMNIDFATHVALIAVVEEGGPPAMVGVGRYIVMEPGKAEVAFAVVDGYQGQGIGAVLMRHLAAIARAVGLKELIAEVLPDNIVMLKVFEKSGLAVTIKRDSSVVHVTLRLA